MRPATVESSVNHSGRSCQKPDRGTGVPPADHAQGARAICTLDTGSQIAIMPGLDQDIPLE